MLIHERVQTKLAQFATVAGILNPTEWQLRDGCPRLVDKGHAGFDLLSNLICVRVIFGKGDAAKPIAGIAG